MIVSMPMDEPITYQITKVENTTPRGVNQFTLYQDVFNRSTDYNEGINMYADYYQGVTPISEELYIDPSQNTPEDKTTVSMNIDSTATTIKIGGSYRTLIATCNKNTVGADEPMDVTQDYSDYKWSYYINDVDISEFGFIDEKVDEDSINKIKIKFIKTSDSLKYLNSDLIVKCSCSNGDIEKIIVLKIISL